MSLEQATIESSAAEKLPVLVAGDKVFIPRTGNAVSVAEVALFGGKGPGTVSVTWNENGTSLMRDYWITELQKVTSESILEQFQPGEYVEIPRSNGPKSVVQILASTVAADGKLFLSWQENGIDKSAPYDVSTIKKVTAAEFQQSAPVISDVSDVPLVTMETPVVKSSESAENSDQEFFHAAVKEKFIRYGVSPEEAERRTTASIDAAFIRLTNEPEKLADAIKDILVNIEKEQEFLNEVKAMEESVASIEAPTITEVMPATLELVTMEELMQQSDVAVAQIDAFIKSVSKAQASELQVLKGRLLSLDRRHKQYSEPNSIEKDPGIRAMMLDRTKTEMARVIQETHSAVETFVSSPAPEKILLPSPYESGDVISISRSGNSRSEIIITASTVTADNRLFVSWIEDGVEKFSYCERDEVWKVTESEPGLELINPGIPPIPPSESVTVPEASADMLPEAVRSVDTNTEMSISVKNMEALNQKLAEYTAIKNDYLTKLRDIQSLRETPAREIMSPRDYSLMLANLEADLMQQKVVYELALEQIQFDFGAVYQNEVQDAELALEAKKTFASRLKNIKTAIMNTLMTEAATQPAALAWESGLRSRPKPKEVIEAVEGVVLQEPEAIDNTDSPYSGLAAEPVDPGVELPVPVAVETKENTPVELEKKPEMFTVEVLSGTKDAERRWSGELKLPVIEPVLAVAEQVATKAEVTPDMVVDFLKNYPGGELVRADAFESWVENVQGKHPNRFVRAFSVIRGVEHKDAFDVLQYMHISDFRAIVRMTETARVAKLHDLKIQPEDFEKWRRFLTAASMVPELKKLNTDSDSFGNFAQIVFAYEALKSSLV